MSEVEIAPGIVHLDTVHQQQIGVLPAAPCIDRCRTAASACLGNRHAGNFPQQFVKGWRLLLSDVILIEGGSRNSQHAQWSLYPSRRNQNILTVRCDAQHERDEA